MTGGGADRMERVALAAGIALAVAGAISLAMPREPAPGSSGGSAAEPGSAAAGAPSEPRDPAAGGSAPADAAGRLALAELLVRESRVRLGNLHRAVGILERLEADLAPGRQRDLAGYARAQTLLQEARTGHAALVREQWAAVYRARALRQPAPFRQALRDVLEASPDPSSPDHRRARRMLGESGGP